MEADMARRKEAEEDRRRARLRAAGGSVPTPRAVREAQRRVTDRRNELGRCVGPCEPGAATREDLLKRRDERMHRFVHQRLELVGGKGGEAAMQKSDSQRGVTSEGLLGEALTELEPRACPAPAREPQPAAPEPDSEPAAAGGVAATGGEVARPECGSSAISLGEHTRA